MSIAAVFGLGNPGQEYAATRHNVGFRVVDELARRFRLKRWERKGAALIARRAGSRPVVLIKPQTYMNLSGQAVADYCLRAQLTSRECLVVVDDVDLPLGELRLRERGGPGSHNGLRSIVEAVGEDFPRLRLGIRGERPWADLADYVLADFEPDETAEAESMVGRAADALECALYEGPARAASRFNGPTLPAGSE